MPCSNEGYDDGYKITADAAVRAACDLAKVARSMKGPVWNTMSQKLSKQTLAWIERHDEIDARREREERAEAERKETKKAALAKLSAKERAVLGIR